MKKLFLSIVCVCISMLICAQVSKTVNVTAGSLSSLLTVAEKTNVTNLTVSGTIDARDFKTMRDDMPVLAVLDLSGVTIAEYTGTGGTDFYRSTYSEKAIPSCAFWGKKGLTSINLPLSVTSIQRRAFSTCTGLTSIFIPSSVIDIEYLAFSDCTYLIIVDITNPNYSSLDGVLFDKTKSILIQCPTTKSGSYIIPSSVTTIEKGAFSDCTRLTTVTIPPSVTSIMSGAFHTCESLNSLTIPSSVTSIHEGAFAYCVGLSTVTIPSSITSIDKGLFMFCTGLKSVIIPSSVDSIGLVAFYGCTGLSTINLPLSVKIIESEAFSGCVGLTSLSIPPSVNTISNGAFNGCTGLTSLFIPASVTTIGSEAFNGCLGLISITVTRIVPLDISSAYNIFGMNKNLCTLNVPFGSKNTYQAASQWQDFRYIVEATNGFILGVKTAGLPATAGSTTTIDLTSTVNWTVSSDQTWLKVSPTSGSGNQTLTLTAEANTLPYRKATVTVSASGLDSQTVSVTQVDSNTPLILTAGSLKNLFTVNELSTITKLTVTGIIDARDFKTMRDDMPLLAELDLSGSVVIAYFGKDGTYGTREYPDNTIPINALAEKTSLTSVILPLSVTAIGEFAFWGCSGLKGALYLSSNILNIGDQALSGFHGFFTVDPSNPSYSSLDGVLFNKTQTSLFQCPTSKLGNYVIPSTVTTIGRLAFFGCTGLTSIIIPSSVTAYGYAVFCACGGLASISVDSAYPVDLSSSQDVFTALNTQIVDLYVPVGSINAYKTANQWKQFKNIKEFIILDTKLINSDKISLSPNPATDGFRVDGIYESALLSFFDIGGRLLFSNRIEYNEYVPINFLPQGVYVVKIKTKAGILERKIIKK